MKTGINIENVSLPDIRPYENNPRQNDNAVEKVAESIRAFGFKVPLVIDADGVIVTGHTRYKAAKQLGLEKVPCIRATDLTPEQVRAFRLADNKVAEFAQWDFDLLQCEIKELKDELPDMDLSAFGFLEIDREQNHIEDLLQDGFGVDEVKENDFFSITFSFPNEKREVIESFVKKKSKDYISALIQKEAEKNGD